LGGGAKTLWFEGVTSISKRKKEQFAGKRRKKSFGAVVKKTEVGIPSGGEKKQKGGGTPSKVVPPRSGAIKV